MLEVRPRDLIWIFIILLYFPVCLLFFLRLRSRLSSTSKRLAIGMLAAQVIVIVLSLAIRPTSLFQEWLWAIDGEWNIPSILASTQIALVASVALFIALLNRTMPSWRRLYMLGICLVFLILGLDEFFDLRRQINRVREFYIAAGMVITIVTAAVAIRSPRRTWIWHICLIVGLSLVAIGGLVFDSTPNYCGSIGFVRPYGGCLDTHHLEESLEFLGAWLVLVAMLGQFSGIAPTPQPKFRRMLYLVPVLWILLLIRESPVPHVHHNKSKRGIQNAAVRFESGEYLYGYHFEMKDDAVLAQLYSYPWQSVNMELGYSIHLVDQNSGDSVASRDEFLNRDRTVKLFGEYFVRVYVQEIEIDIPPQTPVNRALRVVLTLWRDLEGEFAPEQVISSDRQLLGESQVVLGEIVIPAATVRSRTFPVAEFDNGFTLDAVDMPESATPGETLAIRFTWHAVKPGREDHVQFLHLGHVSPPREGGSVEGGAGSVESGNWFVFDQQPLGSRLPTRLWYGGLADSETWQVLLPAELATGRYTVFTGLYRTRDQERVPSKDSDGTPWLEARVPLGILTIE